MFQRKLTLESLLKVTLVGSPWRLWVMVESPLEVSIVICSSGWGWLYLIILLFVREIHLDYLFALTPIMI